MDALNQVRSKHNYYNLYYSQRQNILLHFLKYLVLEHSLHLPIKVSILLAPYLDFVCIIIIIKINNAIESNFCWGHARYHLKVCEVHELLERIPQLVPCQFIIVMSKIKHAYPAMSWSSNMDLCFSLILYSSQ